jgi:hypothetical protein
VEGGPWRTRGCGQAAAWTGEVETDSKDKEDRAPPWWAIVNGYEPVVKLLLGNREVNRRLA